VKNILLIDSDLGFVFWLGHVLRGAGFEALPAKSVADAIALLSLLAGQVDLLIFNPCVNTAASFAADLKRSDQRIKTIAVLPEEMPAGLSDIDAYKRKTYKFDTSAQEEWLSFIRRVLSSVNTTQ